MEGIEWSIPKRIADIFLGSLPWKGNLRLN